MIKDFFREFFNLEEKSWKESEPYDFEKKGRMLLNKNDLTSSEKREFVEEILSLYKMSQVIGFAIGLRYPQTPTMKGMSELNTYMVISDLVERVEGTMVEKFPAEHAVIVFDSQEDREDKELALEFGNYLYGEPQETCETYVSDTPIFASSLLLLPMTIAGFSANAGPEWLTTVTAYLGRGQLMYLLLYSSFIAFFAFFYTSVVFNPSETADNLKKNGGFLPGIRPGKNTAEYLDYVLTRLTTLGAIYLVAISMLPELLISNYSVPFYFGGTSLLIVVTVTMDTVAQVQSHLLAHQYEGLIKKSRLRGRRG